MQECITEFINYLKKQKMYSDNTVKNYELDILEFKKYIDDKDVNYKDAETLKKYKDRIEKQLSENVTFCQFYYSKYPYEVQKIVGNYFIIIKALKSKASLNIPFWRKFINPLIVLKLTIKKYLK